MTTEQASEQAAEQCLQNDNCPPSTPDEQLSTNPVNAETEALLEFERNLEKGRALFIQNPLSRPALYRILEACNSQRYNLYPLEDYIQQLPEYAGVTQAPYFLIQWLLDVFALDMFELDENGNDVTEADKETLTEDEIDDLVAGFAFQTNDLGRSLLEIFDPANRLQELLLAVPERYDTYIELLEFLSEKRSYAEVDLLLRDRDILMFGLKPDDRPIQPSVFIDKLAATGSIVYKEGWQLSNDGREFLRRTRGKEL